MNTVSRPSFYALVTVLLAGCGGGASAEPSTARTAPAARTVAAPQCARTVAAAGTARTALAAVARGRVAVFDRPGGRVVEWFERLNPNGVPTVFGVVARRRARDCADGWYRVRLPRRPNHRLGWIRARDVVTAAVRTRLLIDLSDRRVTLFRDGRKLISARAAIGSSATPTPTGTFYVDQRLLAADPTGPFGPGAVGVAAYSEVLTGWAQGGPIAVHGTNRPDLIGRAVSNGCLRVRNDVLRRIFAIALPGTPVEIRS